MKSFMLVLGKVVVESLSVILVRTLLLIFKVLQLLTRCLSGF